MERTPPAPRSPHATEFVGPGLDQPDLDDLDPRQLLVSLLLDGWRDLGQEHSALIGEMWASELLGMFSLGAPPDTDPAEIAQAQIALVETAVEVAAEQPSSGALAALHALAVVGPALARPSARDGAVRLARAGVAAPQWIGAIGRPEVRECWRYGDAERAQESITTTWSYPDDEAHAVTVVLDHRVGGGIKDCWVSEDADGVRLHTEMLYGETANTVLETLSPQRAGELLRIALTAPECPSDEEQEEDVAMSRAVVRARVALLVPDA